MESENKQNGRLLFTPRTVARGSETLDAYSKRQANQEAARDAVEKTKRERFRKSCERGRQFLSRKKILEYWLTQVESAMSGPKKYWGDIKKFSWPKDKAIIYAIMAICVENAGSVVRFIPDSLQQTKQYKFNKYVWNWVETYDLSVELMNYIEADLIQEDLIDKKNSGQVLEDNEAVEEANKKGLLRPELDGRSKALILRKQHPDWKHTRVANEAGVSRQSLYRWPEYKKLCQLLNYQGSLPQGSKNKDGSIEAIAEE